MREPCAPSSPAPRRGRRRLLLSLSGVAVAVVTASSAWACAPTNRQPPQTTFDSCTPPPGATRECKARLGTPAFPFATSLKGPQGSTVIAWVPGSMPPGVQFDLMFVSKPQMDAGVDCHNDPSTVIGGPVMSTVDGGISTTLGKIPANAPLGGGQVCFSERPTHLTKDSVPALFKVVI